MECPESKNNLKLHKEFWGGLNYRMLPYLAKKERKKE